MYRQLNSPSEIGRRLAYLLYIFIFMIYLFSCVIALAKHRPGDISVAVLAFAGLCAIRYSGYRWFDFQRLTQSFPVGCAKDCVPIKIRTEVESLVFEFHAPEAEWARRAAIRKHLLELEEQVPEIYEAYEAELREVLAA